MKIALVDTSDYFRFFLLSGIKKFHFEFPERLLGRNWSSRVVCLFSDSRIAWLREDKEEVEDSLTLSDAPELLAAGQWVWRIPNPPALPTGACPKLAIAMGQSTKKAHWFLCRSQNDLM